MLYNPWVNFPDSADVVSCYKFHNGIITHKKITSDQLYRNHNTTY